MTRHFIRPFTCHIAYMSDHVIRDERDRRAVIARARSMALEHWQRSYDNPPGPVRFQINREHPVAGVPQPEGLWSVAATVTAPTATTAGDTP